MAQSRPHWLLYVAIVAFAGYFALLAWSSLYPPGTNGFRVSFSNKGVHVDEVAQGSAAERAGIRPGDRIVSIDGIPVTDFVQFRVHSQNAMSGDTHMWAVAHDDGRQISVPLTISPRQRAFEIGRPLAIVVLAVLGLSLTLGILTALTRPRDPSALFGGLFLASLGVASMPLLPRGMAANWRALPAPLGWILWGPALASLFASELFFLFAARFPRPPSRARWWPWLAAAPALILFAQVIRLEIDTVYAPAAAMRSVLPGWIKILGPPSSTIYLAAGAGILAYRYRGADVSDRRRIRVVTLGAGAAALGLLSIGLAVTVSSLGASGGASSFLTGQFNLAIAVGVTLFAALPASLSYAILQHRLLDVRIIVRQGLQYAVARGVLLSIVPAAALALIIDLLVHGSEPLARILQARGWMYLGVMGLAAATHAQRDPWMRALDRRFFRDRYEAQKILRSVVADIRTAPDLESAAASVVSRIEAALHPRFVALMAADDPQQPLATRALAPAGAAPITLPPGGKARQLATVLDKPLVLGGADSGWLRRQLPTEESGLLDAAGLDLLVPVPSGGGRQVVLALGAKQSEEPYTGEDLELLGAIADGLSLLSSRGPAPRAPALSECPACGLCHDAGAIVCAQDGAALVATVLPRVLAGRYTLERRLGRGGMGAVYEAQDSALRRQVAVKVVRDDLLTSPDAAARFQEEALAAAAFAHPNVVTVHDYGVFESRAFFVMERLHGRTLRDALVRERRFSVEQARCVLAGLGAAVEAAHARRLVHRDLKPENIFLTGDDGTVKVLDFGIAKFLPSVMTASAPTASGVLVGTLPYMAPEQLAGSPASPSWDIWALGVIVYEVLTGQHPFTGVPPLEWGGALLAQRHRPPSAIVPELSAAWDGFFARALHPEPAQRFASVKAFVAAVATTG